MTSELSSVVQAIITDENEKYFFVQKSGETFRLKKDETTASLKIGDVVTGFLYENSSRKKVFTLKVPEVTNESYGWASVTQVRKDLGVFVDIGLKDKDMVVSLDELPSMKELWPKKNNRLYVTLIKDKKDRTWATMGDGQALNEKVIRGHKGQLNKDLTGTVTQVRLVGTTIITPEGYKLFLHPSERMYEPTLGEEITVRVIGVRPDGVLNVSMRPRAHEAIGDDAEMIVAMLKNRPTRTLPYWDKTDPKTIKEIFGISKGQFKRAIGNLLKAKRITQEEGFIHLIEE